MSDYSIDTDTDEYSTGEKNRHKCGEVFYNEGNIISFFCYLCKAECEQLNSFLEHLQRHNLKLTCQEKNAEEIHEAIDLNNSPPECLPESLLQDEEYSSEADMNAISFEIAYLPSTNAPLKAPERSSKPVVRQLVTSLQCHLCMKTFSDKRNLKVHLVRHENNRAYLCDICNARFKDSSCLKVHRKRHLGIKPHSCEECNKKFISSTELRLHMRSHSGERPFMCSECGKFYKSSSQLYEHLRRHRNDRPHVCTECNKRFFDKKALREHEVIHTGERSHVCSTCQATFSRRKALVEHMKLHSDVKRHVCKLCGKSFAQNAGLYSHMKSHNVALRSDNSK